MECLLPTGSIELGKGSSYDYYGNDGPNWVAQRMEKAEWCNAAVKLDKGERTSTS
jgi:hypothetical protein